MRRKAYTPSHYSMRRLASLYKSDCTSQPSCPACSVQTKRYLADPVPSRVLCRIPSRGGGTQELVDPFAMLVQCLDRGRAPYVAAAQVPQARRNEILNPCESFREMNGSIVGNNSVLCLQTAVGKIT